MSNITTTIIIASPTEARHIAALNAWMAQAVPHICPTFEPVHRHGGGTLTCDNIYMVTTKRVDIIGLMQQISLAQWAMPEFVFVMIYDEHNSRPRVCSAEELSVEVVA